MNKILLARMVRVQRANYRQDTKDRCLKCGKPFQECPHSMGEIADMIENVKVMEDLIVDAYYE